MDDPDGQRPRGGVAKGGNDLGRLAELISGIVQGGSGHGQDPDCDSIEAESQAVTGNQ
jgi:hypothetical protein